MERQAHARPICRPNQVGYARTLSDPADVRRAVAALQTLGVGSANIYIDRGLYGRQRARPFLEAAIAACSRDSALVVASLATLARSRGDLSAIETRLQHAGVDLIVDGRSLQSVSSGTRTLLLSTFDHDLAHMAIDEDGWMAQRRRDPRGGRQRLDALQQQSVREAFDSDCYTALEVAAMFGVSRATVFRIAGPAGAEPRPLRPREY